MEPIVKLVLPLESWVLQKVAGPVYTDAIWRAIALSRVPPPQSLVNTIVRECADLDSPALLAPSYRRRVRNRRKRYVRRQLRDNPLMLAVRGWLLTWWQELEAEGYTADPSRIRKLADKEAEANAYYEGLLQLQGEELPEPLGSLVRARPDAINLFWEFALYGEGGSNPKIPRNSPLFKMLNIDLEKLDTMTSEQGLLYCLSQYVALQGLNGSPPKMANLRQLLRWVVRTHLPPEREPETTPEAISKAREAGLVHKGIVTRDNETGEVVGMDVEDRSVAQPEDMLHLDDKERLCQFAEMAGIDLNEFKPKEQERMLDLLNFFDRGNEKSSKVGTSLKEYYGGRADSEKTQRARLFQKIRESTRHA